MITSLLKSSTYSGFASVLSYGLTILLARNESQLAFAEFTYSIAWALIITQLVDLAATQCLTHFKISTKEKLEVILASVYSAKLATLLFGVVVMMLMKAVFGLDAPLSSLFFIIPAFYLGPVFEMRLHNVLFAKVLFFEKALLLLFCYLYLKNNDLDIVIYIAFFVVSTVSLIYQFFVLGLQLPKLSIVNREVLGKYFKCYWAIYLTLASQIAYGHVSRIIIEAKLGMIAFVSVSLALQIVNALAIVQRQVDRHLRPRVAELIQDSNRTALNALSVRYVVTYLLPLLVGCVVLYAFANDVMVFLFGEKWMAAADYLKYLLPLILTVAILRYLDIFVVALGVGKANLGINVLAAFVLVGLLLAVPEGRGVRYYLITIVGVQIMHIALVIGYLVKHQSRPTAAMPG